MTQLLALVFYHILITYMLMMSTNALVGMKGQGFVFTDEGIAVVCCMCSDLV